MVEGGQGIDRMECFLNSLLEGTQGIMQSRYSKHKLNGFLIFTGSFCLEITCNLGLHREVNWAGGRFREKSGKWVKEWTQNPTK